MNKTTPVTPVNPLRQLLRLLLIVCFVYACANKGPGPTGGPKDETPPRVMKSVPENGAMNFAKQEIQVDFDENISLEKVTEEVVVSPPQQKAPDIRAQGKRLVVAFEDTLESGTTYTIDFGNAIVDLNEKNPLSGYTFSFSTGGDIDTLAIAGILINAEDLNPVSGIIVGIYAEHDDSVFTQKPFLRIGKTDANGYFTINNVKEGTYQLFALGDNTRDYFFQAGEGLAMYDSLVTPTVAMVEHRDTLWADSVTIDTIEVYERPHYYPDNVLLRYFKENKIRQYFTKAERLRPEMFTLYFNTTLAELPRIEPLNFPWDSTRYILQTNATLDTLHYWITDTLVSRVDSLQLAMTYLRTDSIFQLEETTDTLTIAMRKRNVRTKPGKEPQTPKADPLAFKTNGIGTFEIYNPLTLLMDEPLAAWDTAHIVLSEKADTLLKPLPYTWHVADSTGMNFAIRYPWEAEKSYVLDIDSATFRSIYGKVNDRYSANFKIRSLDEYSELKVVLTHYDSTAVIQVLDNKDVPVRTLPADPKATVFRHLKPTDYYIRMFLDANGNGKWDTGDFATRRQPEEVFYYPHKLTLKANFEFTETWDHLAVPLLEQKPLEILKDANKKEQQ